MRKPSLRKAAKPLGQTRSPRPKQTRELPCTNSRSGRTSTNPITSAKPNPTYSDSAGARDRSKFNQIRQKVLCKTSTFCLFLRVWFWAQFLQFHRIQINENSSRTGPETVLVVSRESIHIFAKVVLSIGISEIL